MASIAHHEVGGLQAARRLHDGWSRTGSRRPAALAFTVTGPDGHPVTAYDEQHERDLHLIVVRRDLTGYQHVHPTLDASTGAWSDVTCRRGPGAYSRTSGPPAASPWCSVPTCWCPAPSRRSRSAPTGSTPRSTGTTSPSAAALAGEETLLTATVTRDGEPVTDLQPYLGAYGHLVSLRDGDLGYLHVHPDEDTGPGPAISFHTEFPTRGPLPAVPRLPARRGGAHGRVHGDVEGGHDH